MAAGNPQLYSQFLLDLLDNTEDWVNNNHYAALMNSTHAFSEGHTTWADISANVCVSGDYAPKDLTTEAVTEAAGVVTIDAAAVDFGNTVTITARSIVVLKGTAAAQSGTDELCFSALLDDTADKTSSAGDFDVDWNASGICTVTQTS